MILNLLGSNLHEKTISFKRSTGPSASITVENQGLQQPALDFPLWLKILSFMTLRTFLAALLLAQIDVRSYNNNRFCPSFINSLAKKMNRLYSQCIKAVIPLPF